MILDERRPSSFSFSRYGRRLDQQKQTATNSFHSKSPLRTVEVKSASNKNSNIKNESEKKEKRVENWLFKKVNRDAPVVQMGESIHKNLRVREYNPHFDIVQRHIPGIDFQKQTKRRSMSLNVNSSELSETMNTFIGKKVKLVIPFELQQGRKEEKKTVIETIYAPKDEKSTHNIHSFDSYSSRKPIVQKSAMPDYDVIRSFMSTQYRNQRAMSFAKTAESKTRPSITALLDYNIKKSEHVPGVNFDKQVSREQMNKTSLFRKIFVRVKKNKIQN